MVVARNDGVGIPIFWELLDNKSGNSNFDNRKELLDRVISLIGIDRILLLLVIESLSEINGLSV